MSFLATGNSYKSLGYAFRVTPNTINKIVPETCMAVVAVYGNVVMNLPDTPEGWKELARGSEDRWHLPHPIGAIDGKHTRIKNPLNAGAHYFFFVFFSLKGPMSYGGIGVGCCKEAPRKAVVGAEMASSKKRHHGELLWAQKGVTEGCRGRRRASSKGCELKFMMWCSREVKRRRFFIYLFFFPYCPPFALGDTG